jgi:hypothetical protein
MPMRGALPAERWSYMLLFSILEHMFSSRLVHMLVAGKEEEEEENAVCNLLAMALDTVAHDRHDSIEVLAYPAQ